MGKYGNIISEAKKADTQNAGIPESKKTSKPEKQTEPPVVVEPTEEEMVNLSIRVPKPLRQHWAAEAKRQGTTLTAAIAEALTQKFGEPEDKKTR